MRTTLNLDGALMRAAKRTAAERGVTLTSIIEDALRAELTRPRERPEYRLDFPVVRGGAPPLVDIARRRALYDAMEGLDSGGRSPSTRTSSSTPIAMGPGDLPETNLRRLVRSTACSAPHQPAC
jgi:hypothetical protein